MDISKYVGVPYKERGRTIKGCDCYGLAYIMYKEIKGITLPTHDEMTTDRMMMHSVILKGKQNWVEFEKPNELDLVTFRLMGFVTHIGIMVGKGKFIHNWVNTDTCVERLDSLHWRNRIDGYFRYKSLCS